MDYTLTKDQQRCADLIDGTGTNFALLGKPGVGKSVLIHYLTEYGRKSYTLAAPTGLAATNISGKTLHSIFGIPISQGIIAPDYNNFTRNQNIVNNIRFNIRTLIIDEISMVRADVFDYIDRLCREVKGVEEPFGGIQVVVVGDFCQLPPITNADERKQFTEHGYRSHFVFDSYAFKGFEFLELNEVLRQKGDNSFINILHEARIGEVSSKSMVKLNGRVEDADGIRLHLVSTNKQSDMINSTALSKLFSPLVEFHADATGSWPSFPMDTVLQMKVGAQVLIKKNAADRVPGDRTRGESEVVNGSLGIVTEICAKVDKETVPYIRVLLRSGNEVNIYRARWERKVKERIGDKWVETTVASFEQMPIMLAWAISMHKSQGQTFETVHIDPKRIFAAGQLYVALSRGKSLQGITFDSRVAKSSFRTDNRVLEFLNQTTI